MKRPPMMIDGFIIPQSNSPRRFNEPYLGNAAIIIDGFIIPYEYCKKYKQKLNFERRPGININRLLTIQWGQKPDDKRPDESQHKE